MTERRERLRIGQLWIDSLTFAEALDEIEGLVAAGKGGSVFTPNVDHVVNAETNAAFREAYAAASLSLVDGQPLLWASRLLKAPLPEKISGSDLIFPLVERAAQRGWRVYLLGGKPGVAEAAAAELQSRFAVQIAGIDAPSISLSAGPEDELAIERIRSARAQLVLVALGSPKQELWIHRAADRIRPAVAMAVGASFDFVAGRVRRAPKWISNAGLEWFFRLTQDPRLVWRYLARDPRFVFILLRTVRLSRQQLREPREANKPERP
jgi:N-acetylglucosaminyldiphosphoundecaprenol N-acetyl-beta-D-mannosaminyltransferase